MAASLSFDESTHFLNNLWSFGSLNITWFFITFETKSVYFITGPDDFLKVSDGVSLL